MKARRLLIVDDEVCFLNSMRRGLRKEPYDILLVESAEKALAIMRRKWISIVVSDYNMPGMDGAELLSRVKKLYPEKLTIMSTAVSEVRIAMHAINNLGVYKFFLKPIELNEFRIAIRRALDLLDLKVENEKLVSSVKEGDAMIEHLEKIYPGIMEVKTDNMGYYLPDE